jgi:hypothetical protein
MEEPMQSLAGIDAALSRAVDAKEVPGVVALDCATLSTARQ